MDDATYFITAIIAIVGLGVFFIGITMGVYIGKRERKMNDLKYVPMDVIRRASNLKDF